MHKVLIIEDNQEMRELLSFNLKQAGFRVATAADGIEGLKKASSVGPDVVILDLMLPEMDGFSVCETLRRMPACASVPILIVTAQVSEFARIASLDSGANDYLSKPFSMASLLGRVEALLPVSHAVGP